MRIRSIKPEFWRSESVAALPRDVRLLWIGLWSYVDDNGVGIDDHRLIAADLFALDDPIEAREFVRDGLATLSRALRITRYTVDGRAYLHITGWDEHQRIDRPGKPRYPAPPADLPAPEANETADQTTNADASTRAVATPSRDRRDSVAPGTEEQGNRGTEEKEPPRAGAQAGTRARACPRTRGTTTLAELAASAVRPNARAVVDTWRNSRPGQTRHRPQVIRELSTVVDGLLRDGAEPELVRAALDEWDTRTDVRSPKALTWLYDDAVKTSRGTRNGRPDQRQTRDDKVQGWLTLGTEFEAPQANSARADKVRGWLELGSPDTPLTLAAITGGAA